MRRKFGFYWGCAAASLLLVEGPSNPLSVGGQVQSYLSSLSSPIYVTSAKDGSRRLFVVERGGRIKVFQPDSTSSTLFLDVASLIVSGGEQGLLGLAFHPDFPLNRRFFINYTRDSDGATVIAEYRVSETNANVADRTERILLTINQPYDNHNGGMIDFGPDGYLYIGMGDGGDGNDPGDRAQRPAEHLGKMLRIDVDTPNGSVPYSSPPDNPYYGAVAGRDEIYAIGLRNPWRWSFDRAGARELYCADVGQGDWEEINIIRLGGNYGWRIMEGNHCNPNINEDCTPPLNHIPPIAEYGQTNSRCSITGGYVYRGLRNTNAISAGAYICGDYCSGEILQLSPADATGRLTQLIDTSLRISSFGEDESAELYVVDLNGTVRRLVSSPAPTACTYDISPTNQNFSWRGGSGSIALTAGADCAWLAASHADWIQLSSPGRGQGNTTLQFTVSPNTSGKLRSGRIMVGGRAFLVSQDMPVALAIQRASQRVTILWPTNAAGYTLEATPTLSPLNWQPASTPSVQGTNYVVSEQISDASRFFRLRKP